MRVKSRTLVSDAHRRWWPNLIVWGMLGIFAFRQRVGETTFDTKLDLAIAPTDFLDRALYAWNPFSSFGEMQNQAYGYLFPHGGFFALGEALGMPAWITQRLWSALLLVVAYEGARLLFRVIDRPRDRPWLPMVAGLAYVFAPRMLGLSGALSGEVHPTAVLPWVVLPLVLAVRGHLTPFHGAAWSGVAVLMMGGVNATEVLCALPVGGFIILSAIRHPVGRRLALWWPLAVIAATLWWVTALLKQGRYSPPFLDYIETAATTTQPLGWANVVRGTDHWLSFVWVGGEPWWPGSYYLSTDPWMVGVAGAVAAISLIGLFHRRMPLRVPLAVSALFGIVAMTLGNIEAFGSPLSPTFQALLDGVLSPFRNIHKFDPIVRLPLALGFAHALGLFAVRLRGLSTLRRRLRLPEDRVKPLVLGAGVVLLLVSAQPLFTGDLRKQGWDEIPDAWYEAAGYLERNAEGRRTLLLPGSGFGIQTWGWTVDEPLQPLAGSPWVTRNQVPMAPGPTIRYLDAIEERIQDGIGSPVLADALARAGIGFVLVRRDLDLWASEAPSPARVDLALSRSPGLEKVASFGRTAFGDTPMLDVYEVDREVPLLEAVDLTSVKALAGGPEDAVAAMEEGLLNPGEVTINTAEPGWEGTPDIVGDGYRRRERQFGRLLDSVSQVMAQEERYRNKRAAHDYPGVSEEGRVYARYTSLAAVEASSSSGYADSFGAIQPERGPYSAIDGTEDTFWSSAPFLSPTNQWLELTLLEPTPLPSVRVVAGVDGISGVPIRRIRVEAGGQVVERGVDPDTGEVRIPLDGRPVDRVRISVTSVLGDPDTGVVSLREVSLGGVDFDRTLVVPDVRATGSSAFVFRARPHRRSCVDLGSGPQCDAQAGRASEEEFGLNRTFTTHGEGRFVLDGTVVARTTGETHELLRPLRGLRATATSTFGGDPLVTAQRAVDGNAATVWLATRGEEDPRLELEWDEERTISRLTIEPAFVQSSSSPSRAVIEAEGETRTVDLGPDSPGFFQPLTASKVQITFPMPARGPDGQPRAPLGIAELNLEGVEDLKVSYWPEGPTGAVCGFGPDVVLDGRRFPTRVEGTVADVSGGTGMELRVCGRRAIDIPAGTHQLWVDSSDQFAVTSLALTPVGGSPVTERPRGREVRVLGWQRTERRVWVGPGAEGVLRIPENMNIGWEATLDGEPLEPLRLDGWQQGFRVPSGVSGEVQLSFVPDRTYRRDLLAGALAAVSLVFVAVLLQLRRDRRDEPVRRWAPVRVSPWLGRWSRLTGVVLVSGSYLLGGLPVLVGSVVGFFLRERRRLLFLTAGGGVLLAGTLQALSSWRTGAVDITWADLVAGAAIGIFASTLIRPSGQESADEGH